MRSKNGIPQKPAFIMLDETTSSQCSGIPANPSVPTRDSFKKPQGLRARPEGETALPSLMPGGLVRGTECSHWSLDSGVWLCRRAGGASTVQHSLGTRPANCRVPGTPVRPPWQTFPSGACFLWTSTKLTRIFFFPSEVTAFFSNGNITLTQCQKYSQCQKSRKSQRNLKNYLSFHHLQISLVRFWNISCSLPPPPRYTQGVYIYIYMSHIIMLAFL